MYKRRRFFSSLILSPSTRENQPFPNRPIRVRPFYMPLRSSVVQVKKIRVTTNVCVPLRPGHDNLCMMQIRIIREPRTRRMDSPGLCDGNLWGEGGSAFRSFCAHNKQHNGDNNNNFSLAADIPYHIGRAYSLYQYGNV